MKQRYPFALCVSFMVGLFFFHSGFSEDKPSSTRLKLLAQFGGMDVPEEQILNNPNDIAISEEGFIYILDSNDNDIKSFLSKANFYLSTRLMPKNTKAYIKNFLKKTSLKKGRRLIDLFVM